MSILPAKPNLSNVCKLPIILSELNEVKPQKNSQSKTD